MIRGYNIGWYHQRIIVDILDCGSWSMQHPIVKEIWKTEFSFNRVSYLL